MLATRVIRLRQGRVRNLHGLIVSRHRSRFAYPAGQVAYEDDYTDTPNYPPIDPETVRYTEARRQRLQAVDDWHKGMLAKETVEEKLMELNISRRYGWFTTVISDQPKHYDAWELIKYVTRTHMMEPVQVQVKTGTDSQPTLAQQHLPSIYYSRELNEKVAHFKSKLSTSLLDIVKFELEGVDRPYDEDELAADVEHRRTTSIVNQISRFLVHELSSEVNYLRTAQVDRNPKIEAFWMLGGFARTELQKKALRNLTGVKKEFLMVKEDDPIERNLQYDGTNIVQLRTEFPFGPFLDQDAKFATASESEPASRFKYDYRSYGYFPTLRYATQNAGHWSGCQSRSNLLSIHSTHHLRGPGRSPLENELRANDPAWIAREPQLLDAQAAIASFAKLVAQANVLGFNQWCDVPYPLATQTILTDGDEWSFYTYQLNTFKFDGRSLPKNKRTNICWSTGRMKLLQEDGNLNPSVVDHLLKFYLAPSLMDAEARFETPHIKQNLNDMEDEYRRNFIFYNFQTMVSQRNYDDHAKQLPEIYQWEKFYKVNHQTRPADARRRFFELPEQMGPKPYHQAYRMIDPNKIKSKRLRFMLKELEDKKKAERAKKSYEAAKDMFRHKYDERNGEDKN